ncbi:hypothetical protein LUZ63_012215 [Rhynchospora breviuscula]|uniref:Reverse transcriptase zinc-binding domain-containing protein n=1 Tax=Rhynchospora breviuscula TaxID=2022672 RepID=A0A9Q0HRA1_9POAL|nr:hypothetical protein LUZ63_012215 [Rhynchospora breviuscula]
MSSPRGWKSPLLSRAGRIVLASSVLSSIPVFFMSAFQLPSWVIKAIDKVRRIFIWQGNSGRGLPLLAWSRVCLPKELGGLGLIDLKLQNISLLLRWLWRLYSQPSSLWSTLAKKLFAKRNSNTPPLGWNGNGSFFWKQLLTLRYFFQISTTTELQNGENTLFWFDNWAGTLLSFFQASAHIPVRRFVTVSQTFRSWFDVVPAPMTETQDWLYRHFQRDSLTRGIDIMRWKWSSDGNYSSSSVYKALVSAGKVKFHLQNLWRLKIPPTVKTFLFLLAQDRLLTQCQLMRRNINVQHLCHLCQQDLLETADHLFCICPFSMTLWNRLGLSTVAVQGAQKLLLHLCSLDKLNPMSTKIATALWSLWLERNNRLFRNERRTLQAVHDWLVQQAALFFKFS